MVCPNCGANNDSSAAFCFNCGTRLEQAPAAAGLPTINIPPDERPFDVPTMSPPPFGLPPQTPPVGSPTIRIQHDAQRIAPPPASGPPPFSVPASQLPATPYSTQPFGAPVVIPNSTAAIISLVFGIVSWFVLPFIGAIVAIVAGHMARGEIRRSDGAIGGKGMATAGLILGYANLGVLLLGCVFFVFIIGLAGLSSISS